MSEPTPSESYVPSPVQVDLVPTYGAYSIGTWISCILFGCNLMSTFQYYGNFPRDSIIVKALVALVQAVNIWYIVIQCEMNWGTLVTNWGNTVVLDYANWGWYGAIFCPCVIMSLVQFYFAYRIWVLSGFKVLGLAISTLVVTLSAVGFGFGMWFFAGIVKFRHPSKYINQYALANEIWLILTAVADVFITLSMVFFIRRVPTVHPRTARALRKWTHLAFETNAITAVGALIAVGLRTRENPSKSLIYGAVAIVNTQIYPLSLLAVLNSRSAFQQTRDKSSASSFPSSARKSPGAWGTPNRTAASSGHYHGSMVEPPPTLPPMAAGSANSHSKEVHLMNSYDQPARQDYYQPAPPQANAYLAGGGTASTAYPAYEGDLEAGRKREYSDEGYSYAR